jgi:eukaryotic-like serine/threonine-protein kinase
MPEKIGQYTVVSELGRGGMGVVYKAQDDALHRFVAIKVLTERLTDDPTFLQRFIREARAAAGISHPNIIQIYSIGEDQGNPYFVMEYVNGRSLSRVLHDEGRIGNPRAAQVILQAAQGLAAAHDRGIIHRDMKPANLILDERGIVKIADFGLALPVEAGSRLTATGLLMGTPGYLSPEQCRGEAVDHRTDIYALGITFYELLSGTTPFKAESPLALLHQITQEQPPDIGSLNPDVDEETRRILQKMIAKDREQRYQSCHDIVTDLENFIAGRGVRSVTAGLAVRPAPAAGATPSPMVPTVAITPSNPAAPTVIVPSSPPAPAPVTMPDVVKSSEPPTLVTPVATTNPPPRKSSAGLVVALIAVVLVIASAGAAVFFGMRTFNRWRASRQATVAETTTAKPAAPAPAEQPKTTSADVLLSQPVNPSTIALSTEGTTPIAQTAAPPSGQTAAQQTAQPTAQASARAVEQEKPLVQPSPSRSDARQSAPRVAQKAAAESAPPQRRLSGVAVAVTGDAGLIGAVSTVIVSELESAGLKATDAQSLPATEDLVRGNPSAGMLIDRLRSEGQAVLLLARVDPTGVRELRYLGRSEPAYSSRVTITAYDLATGRPIGSSRSASVEYTARTADRESEKIVGPLAQSIAETLPRQ